MPLRESGLALALLMVAPAMAAQYYVAPNGTPAGDGSIERPWDLATALRPHPSIRPMDTVWMRKGLYTGTFVSRLRGAPGAPVLLRAYPGERAVLDAAGIPSADVLRIEGEWAWYWGLEIMNSKPKRWIETPGSHPADGPGFGVNMLGPNTKLINCVIRDTGGGIGFWRPAVDSEVYGNLVYNNGWRAPDRNHGPALYTQNEQGLKTVRDNLLLNPYSLNLQLYGSSRSRLENYLIEGNISSGSRFLIGGGTPAKNITMVENFLYRHSAEIGYTGIANEGLILRRNYFPEAVILAGWKTIEAAGNSFFRASGGTIPVRITLSAGHELSESVFTANQFWVRRQGDGIASAASLPSGPSRAFDFATWQKELKFDLEGRLHATSSGSPEEAHVFVRRNHYEPNRAHIVAYNWRKKDAVAADISSLNPSLGDAWVLRNAFNPFDEQISGTYEGKPIDIPMNRWAPAMPAGEDRLIHQPTFPEFGVFILDLERAKPVAAHGGPGRWAEASAPGAIAVSGITGLVDAAVSIGPGEASEELAGVAVHVRDSAGKGAWARVLVVSPESVAYVVPVNLAIGPATITIRKDGLLSDGGCLFLQRAAPALFTMNGESAGPASGYSEPGMGEAPAPLFTCSGGACAPVPVNLSASQSDPVLTLFGTAFRGHLPGAPVVASIGAGPVQFLSIEPDEGYPGLDLVRVRVPQDRTQRGILPLRITLESLRSNPVSITFQ